MFSFSLEFEINSDLLNSSIVQSKYYKYTILTFST